MNTTVHSETERGQWFFTTMSHTLYDHVVYKLVIPFIWRCPSQRVFDSYAYNVSDNHLEIGVGTGYALIKSKADPSELSLMDLNSACLNKSAKRLKRYQPNLHKQNVLLPFDMLEQQFDSAGLHFVMHCVPGDFIAKGRAFKHIAATLKSGGVFFGATVLGDQSHNSQVGHSMMARISLFILNTIGIFHNRYDKLAELKAELEENFDFVELEVIGSIVHWRAIK